MTDSPEWETLCPECLALVTSLVKQRETRTHRCAACGTEAGMLMDYTAVETPGADEARARRTP